MSRPARRLLPLGLVFACFGALQAHAADLTVTLQGVRAQTGVLKLAVVDSQAGWDGQAQPLKADGAPPQGDKWADIAALEPVRDFKARHASTLLTFDAVVDAIGQIEAKSGQLAPAQS